MESLDALPSADYASLVTLSNPSDNAVQDASYTTFGCNENGNKPHQEHIYAQVTANGHLQTIPTDEGLKTVSQSEEDDRTLSSNYVTNLLLKTPSVVLNEASNVPDVKQQFPSLLNFYPHNYGSLSAAKENEEAVVKKSKPIPKDSSVFSISGRRVIVSNGFEANGTNHKVDLQEPNTALGLSNEWCSRSTLNSETDPRLQVCTDSFSLCLFVPGTVLCILSPWLLVPIYIIPTFSGSHFQTLIWISCIGSALLVFMGCMVGNIVWLRRGNKWKCQLHCGKGPKHHYWGDSLSSKRTVHTV